MSNSVRPHRQQPTSLPRPWDSPGKSTGVGCHFLLQCMKLKSVSEVIQSCPTLYSLPGSSVHGIFQARVLEWGAIAFSLHFAESSANYVVSPWWDISPMTFPTCREPEGTSIIQNTQQAGGHQPPAPKATGQSLCVSLTWSFQAIYYMKLT